MRFRIEQRLPGTVDEVQTALIDPAFLEEMAKLPRLGHPELLEQQQDGDIIRRQVRYVFAGDLSPAVTAVVEPKRLTWIEDATIDLARYTTEFVIRPDHYANRLRSSGTFVLTDRDGGVTRTAEGDLKVSFPLVGGRVEKAIVSGMEEHAAAEAAALTNWLSTH